MAIYLQNSHEQPRLSHFRGPDVTKALPSFRPHTSVLKLLLDGLHHYGDATAMIECDTGKSATFTDILQLSNSLAAGLQSAELAPGDLVVICCEKSILAYCILLASMFVGATVAIAPYSDIESVERIQKRFKSQEVKAWFYDKRFERPVTRWVNLKTLKPSIMALIDDQHPVLASLFQPSKGFSLYEVRDNKKHVPLILFSSGTTGIPKGIPIKDIAVQLLALFSESYHRSCRSMFTATTMYASSSFSAFLSCILNGHRLIMTNDLNPRKHFEIIEKYKIDRWSSTLWLMTLYNSEPSFHKYDLSSISHIRLGGQTVYGSVLQKFGENLLGAKTLMTIRYGMTETGMLAMWEGTRTSSKIQSGKCGTPGPGVEIKILDEKGNIVPTGCCGKIWVKTISMFPGYWNQPELNQELFDKEGFFWTKDIGYFTNDGFLHYLGREYDLINYRGLKVSPIEIENLLLAHPDVVDAAIVAKPDPTDTEHMIAFVVRKQHSKVTEKDMITYVNDQVKEDERKLRGVVFLDRMPKTYAVKLNKEKLKGLAREYK